MSYEYSSRSGRLEFPNPHAVENQARIIAGAVMIVCSLVLFVISKDSLSDIKNANWLALMPIGVGLFMLMAGLGQVGIAMSKLRFFFGRGEPNSLAKEVGPNANNTHTNIFKYEREDIMEMLRQGAINIEEPRGPLNGFLYATLKDLIFAPTRLRNLAELYFKNLVIVSALSLSYAFSAITVSGELETTIVGAVFLLVTLWFVKPINDRAINQSEEFGAANVAFLLILGIFTPVALNLVLPQVATKLVGWEWMATNTITVLLLLTTFISSGVFFMALLNQLNKPPHSSLSSVTRTLSLNAHPKQVTDEFQREMQKNWLEQIPNRVYWENPPVIGKQETGSFEGDFIQETQPMPEGELRKLTISEALSNKNYTWLTLLNGLGIALFSIGSLVFLKFGVDTMNNPTDLSNLNTAGVGLVLWAVANHSFRAATLLWGKFSFVSKVYWLEMEGSYQNVEIGYGNQFTDRIKSNKKVVNIETMTLRVWAAECLSVVFGKSDVRHVVGMRGIQQEAEYLADHLCDFGADQAVIVAPGSQSDVKRVAALGAMNVLGGAGNHNDLQAAIGVATGMTGMIAADAHRTSGANAGQAQQNAQKAIEESRAEYKKEIPSTGKVCMACDAVAEPEDKFCSDCGAKL